MDLRTFVRPDRPRFVPLPEIGRPAPPLPGASPALGRPRVVAFLRHVGCPFAELTMKTLDAASGRHPEVQFLAVSQGTPAATAVSTFPTTASGVVKSTIASATPRSSTSS